MHKMDKIISNMDFRFFGTGQHKIDAETFLKNVDAVLLDVRAIEETSVIKICLNQYFPVIEIPFHELPEKLNALPRDKHIGIFCSSGVRSAIAFAYLKSNGFANVRMIEGGYTQLTEAIMPGKIFKHLHK